MSLAPRFSLFILLALSACATQAPVSPSTATLATDAARPAPESAQMISKIDALADSTSRLRAQYDAMGETLKWQEGEIAALRQAAKAHAQPISLMPTTTTAPTVVVTPKEQPAEVGSLTEQDLQPIKLAPESKSEIKEVKPAPVAQAATTGYYVHVASFADQASAAKGWAQFKSKNGRLLGAISGVATSFTDKAAKNWQRVWAGPYATAKQANATCAALKKKGSWCEVLPLAEPLTTKLP